MPKATLSLLPKFRVPASKADSHSKKKAKHSPSAATKYQKTEPPPPSYESLYNTHQRQATSHADPSSTTTTASNTSTNP